MAQLQEKYNDMKNASKARQNMNDKTISEKDEEIARLTQHL